MVHVALPFGLEIDLGALVAELLGTYIPVGLDLTAALDLSPIFDFTADSSWLFNPWNQLVLLYAQSF
jgi:hypothetical protein